MRVPEMSRPSSFLRPDPYRVRLENFEGPLDLLLHLIKREELNIYDIPIAHITEQYLTLIVDLSSVDIDRASEFLVMAATLLDIKSKMLLPKPPKVAEELPGDQIDDADPRAELVRQLVEYSAYKQAASALREREQAMTRIYTRQFFAEGEVPGKIEGVTLEDLVSAFREVLKEEFNWREVPREEIPLREKIRELNFRISRSPQGIRFRDLFGRGGSRLEIIVTFLALLELIRQRRAVAVQEATFGDILIRRVLVSETAATPADD
jgi:segregation and condensation protein A